MNGNENYSDASPYSEYADLDNWGAQATPRHSRAPGLEAVPDGSHDCEILHALLDNVSGNRIVRTELRVGGLTIEYLWWLNKQEAVNGFLADMVSLGFPAQQWGAGTGRTPLSLAIPDCVGKLKGIKFRASKSSRQVAARPAQFGQPATAATTYHNLHIASRISGTPMPAAAAPPVQPAPVVPPVPRMAYQGAAGTEEEIPF